MSEYSREMRVCKSSDYRYILNNGRKYNSKSFILFSCKKKSGPTRLGIIVSKKVGGAVLRNYLKRVFRDIYRNEYDILCNHLDIVIILKKNAENFSFTQLKSEFVCISNRL